MFLFHILRLILISSDVCAAARLNAGQSEREIKRGVRRDENDNVQPGTHGLDVVI